MDKSGAGAGFLRELRFPLPIYIPFASPQSSSLSPEAGRIGQEWPQCKQPHKKKIPCGFQLLTEEETASVIFFYLFLLAVPILLIFQFICYLSYFCLLGLYCGGRLEKTA
jgi:hypothetical protein